jgi:tetratricopeptide (TPR) repeat protein
VKFICKLKSKKCKGIITTNFDILIEKALENIHFINGVDYIVYASEKDYLKFDDKIPFVVKIHGTASLDKSFHNLRTTIEDVAKNEYIENRRYILCRILDLKNPILFFGYSCSDHFDINPILENYKSTEKVEVIFNQHSEEANIVELPYKEGNNPFNSTIYSGYCLNFHTDMLIEILYEKYGFIYKNIEPDFLDDLCDIIISKWAINLKDSSKSLIIAEIYEELRDKKCIEHYNRCTFLGIYEQNKELYVDSILSLIINEEYFNIIPDKNVSVKYYKYIDQYCIKNKLKLQRIDVLFRIGRCYEDLGEHKLALKFYSMSRRIILKNSLNSAKNSHQIGSVYSTIDEFRKAIIFLNKAIKQRETDIAGIQKTNHEIAIVYFKKSFGFVNTNKKNAHLNKSIFFLNQIVNDSRKLGDMLMMSRALNMLGLVSYFKEDYESALKYYNESKEIKIKVKDYNGLSILEINTARVYIKYKKIELALRHIDESDKYRHNNELLLNRNNVYRGVILYLNGQTEQGEALILASFKYADKNNNYLEIDNLKTILEEFNLFDVSIFNNKI